MAELHPTALARAADESHPEWGDHDRSVVDRIEPAFVATSWLASLAVSAVVAVFAIAVFALAADTPLLGATGTELGVATVIGALSTFIGFAATMTWRLVRVDHDRLVNSLAVGVLNIAVAAVVALTEVVVRSSTGSGIGDMFQGTDGDQLANTLAVLERTSAAALVGCLLAVGMVPASGDRPSGTQGAADSDSQL